MRVDWQQPVNKDCQLNTGLVSWWLCGENPYFGGGTFRDLCNRNHGTLTNMDPATDWVPGGRLGGFGALDFDGTNDCVVATIAAIPRPCTVAGWYNPAVDITSGNQWIFAHDGAANNGWRISRSGGIPEYLRLTFGAVADYSFTSLTMPNENTWYFFAVIVPANSGTAIGYLSSGGGITSQTASVGTMSGTPSQISIGGLSWFSASCNGRADDLTIWNRALSDSEVMALYNDSRRGHPEMLNWIRPTWYLDQAGGGGGRTTRNTRSHPLGIRSGINWRVVG